MCTAKTASDAPAKNSSSVSGFLLFAVATIFVSFGASSLESQQLGVGVAGIVLGVLLGLLAIGFLLIEYAKGKSN